METVGTFKPRKVREKKIPAQKKEKKAPTRVIKYFDTDVREIIEDYEDAGKTFTVKKTSYSTQINIPSENKKILVSKSINNNTTFMAAKKIKKDLDQIELEIPQINRGDLNYYGITERTKSGETYYPKVTNVDITAAYPYTLYLNKLITQETFNYLMTLGKIDRLKCVGMIATQKTVYEFINGKLFSVDIEKNVTQRNTFFYIVKTVNDLMGKVAKVIGENFLFFWVDGIYFLDSESREIEKEVIKILQADNYLFKTEYLINFVLNNNEEAGLINLNFQDSKGRTKYFCIPSSEDRHKNKDNEFLFNITREAKNNKLKQ